MAMVEEYGRTNRLLQGLEAISEKKQSGFRGLVLGHASSDLGTFIQ